VRAGHRRARRARRPGVYPRLHTIGERKRTGIALRAERLGIPVQVLADGPIAQVFFVDPHAELTSERALRIADGKKGTRFAYECLRRGIFTFPNSKLYLSLAHTDADIDWTLDAMEEALHAVA
jgi:glutamate-1-semialdehyde aminotransferase